MKRKTINTSSYSSFRLSQSNDSRGDRKTCLRCPVLGKKNSTRLSTCSCSFICCCLSFTKVGLRPTEFYGSIINIKYRFAVIQPVQESMIGQNRLSCQPRSTNDIPVICYIMFIVIFYIFGDGVSC